MDKRDKQIVRVAGWALVWVVGCVLWWQSGGLSVRTASANWTVPPAPPILVNGSFECTNGFTLAQNAVGNEVRIPTGWSVTYVFGAPQLLSSRMFRYDNKCDPNGPEVSKMEGHDSWYLRSQDIATPPNPGKPFDLVLYQQVPATYGAAYSLSGWMASECGDNPNGARPCPEGQYVMKMVGIDPNGGTDHTSPAIEWVQNDTDRRWHGLFTSATALTDTITVFGRVISPFQFHNNKGLIDAFSLVAAPLSALHPMSATVDSGSVEVSWFGQQSADIEDIAGGNYDLLFDVQARPLPSGEWRDLVSDTKVQGSTIFAAPCVDISYEFRVRARAEQPEGEPGVFPNHRYPGVWSQPQTVHFVLPPSEPITVTPELTRTIDVTPAIDVTPTINFTPTLYLPVTARTTSREC